MIPVALRLKNFMSYGEDAPVLDFEQFQVACLSGRNGQGKSALLDALTWALWGEARKSSGQHKPDAELLRIGSYDMSVEFTFDIEGERYRVYRWYQETQTGKTSKSGLELNVYETGGTYRPLTGATQRETQERIGEVVGLDYDTFINSAFLLQGRSDEFTKKRPSERKEVLGKILNLSRYDALAERAAERDREARRRLEQADVEIARLQDVLAPEDEWQAERAQLASQIDEQQATLTTLREQERGLVEALAVLNGRAREAESLRRILADLEHRRLACERTAETLGTRIAEAEALIARADQIERDHTRFRQLQHERDGLDDKSVQVRGIEKQIEQKERALADKKTAHERQMERLMAELKDHEREHGRCGNQLSEEPTLRRRLAAAQAALAELEAMQAIRAQREQLRVQIEEVERRLHGQREALSSRVQLLETQIQRSSETLPSLESLERRLCELYDRQARREALQAELEAVIDRGKDAAEALHERSAMMTARQEELAQRRQTFAHFHSGDDRTCPTCGTDLTPQHRTEVETHYRTQIAALEEAEAALEREIEQIKSDRDVLREQYKQVKTDYEALAGVTEQIAQAQAQHRHAEEEQKRLDEQRREAVALRYQLEAEAFGHEARTRLQVLRLDRDKLPFDEVRHDILQKEAALAEHFRNRLQELQETAGRKEQLERLIERTQAEIDALRQQLDSGVLLGPLQQDIARLRLQYQQVGFDPIRFQEVKEAIQELGDPGARLSELNHAFQNRDEWREQREKALADADELAAEQQAQVIHLEKVEASLQDRVRLEGEHAAQQTIIAEAEALLQNLRHQDGQLAARLGQARRDRESLSALHAAHLAALHDRQLYGHLRTAFGKHGIQSLIIEQTLPDVEERANDLLERVTDGRMHVRLETLKDKKTGGTMETLDIKITDEQGVSRPYETFSGGEAFRVNFALRLALAQLLAERSGVRIRTLIIDEGFGTQDAQGVQSLVEAIERVREDFDKIVVITHLGELKEAFPIRIEVEKDPVEGSRFEVIGV